MTSLKRKIESTVWDEFQLEHCWLQISSICGLTPFCAVMRSSSENSVRFSHHCAPWGLVERLHTVAQQLSAEPGMIQHGRTLSILVFGWRHQAVFLLSSKNWVMSFSNTKMNPNLWLLCVFLMLPVSLGPACLADVGKEKHKLSRVTKEVCFANKDYLFALPGPLLSGLAWWLRFLLVWSLASYGRLISRLDSTPSRGLMQLCNVSFHRSSND